MLRIIHFTQLPSTSDYAKTIVDNVNDDLLVIADQQTAGRGRLNERAWLSPPGNFYGTFVFCIKEKQISSDIHNRILRIIVNYLNNISRADNRINDVKIIASMKQPNDIVVNGKKICGILIEYDQNNIFIGIGLNITNSPVETSTNVFDEYGNIVDRIAFARYMYDEIAKQL